MKSLPIRMEFILNDNFSVKDGIDILNKFFTYNHSDVISSNKNSIFLNDFLLCVPEKEFYFFHFLDKSESEIGNKLQFYETVKKSIKYEWDISHRYKFGYEKFKILNQLLLNCESYFIETKSDDGEYLPISLYSPIFCF
ncbi:MAG: hypothetical protein NTW78_06170 [Campylobacterales bacterium]|nr:hypothetical protein [Campylobacterales bacterium]